MRSSTSSSRDRLPGQPVQRLVTGVVVGLALLSALEAAWHHRGHYASVVDDEPLWCVQREKVSSGSHNTVALVGWSRILYGWDTPTFASMWPNHGLSVLAIRGQKPVAVLRDLAQDPRFVGVLICDMDYAGILKKNWGQQQPHVDYYRDRWSFAKKVDRYLRTQLQSRFVVISPEVSLLKLATKIWWEGVAAPIHVHVHPDRTLTAHFPPRNRAHQDAPVEPGMAAAEAADLLLDVPWEQWERDVREGIEPYVKQIQQRGGKVVFIRLPVGSDPHQDRSHDAQHPAWRALQQFTSATTVHFTQVPGLAALACPDGHHLDGVDAPRFTRDLTNELARLGLIGRSGG